MRFWQPTTFERLAQAEAGDSPDDREDEPPPLRREREAVDLAFQPLSSNASLLTRLRAASPTKAVRGEIDVDRIVEQWSRGRSLAEMPRSTRRAWGAARSRSSSTAHAG